MCLDPGGMFGREDLGTDIVVVDKDVNVDAFSCSA